MRMHTQERAYVERWESAANSAEALVNMLKEVRAMGVTPPTGAQEAAVIVKADELFMLLKSATSEEVEQLQPKKSSLIPVTITYAVKRVVS